LEWQSFVKWLRIALILSALILRIPMGGKRRDPDTYIFKPPPVDSPKVKAEPRKRVLQGDLEEAAFGRKMFHVSIVKKDGTRERAKTDGGQDEFSKKKDAIEFGGKIANQAKENSIALIQIFQGGVANPIWSWSAQL
jgi:hypothetical protein